MHTEVQTRLHINSNSSTLSTILAILSSSGTDQAQLLSKHSVLEMCVVWHILPILD